MNRRTVNNNTATHTWRGTQYRIPAATTTTATDRNGSIQDGQCDGGTTTSTVWRRASYHILTRATYTTTTTTRENTTRLIRRTVTTCKSDATCFSRRSGGGTARNGTYRACSVITATTTTTSTCYTCYAAIASTCTATFHTKGLVVGSTRTNEGIATVCSSNNGCRCARISSSRTSCANSNIQLYTRCYRDSRAIGVVIRTCTTTSSMNRTTTTTTTNHKDIDRTILCKTDTA